MKKYFLYIFLYTTTAFTQTVLPDYQTIDLVILNESILKEVNLLRKKAKVRLLYNEDTWIKPANNHVEYMMKNQSISHTQSNKIGKTPMDRALLYGTHFKTVSENLLSTQFKNKKGKPIKTYEQLAKHLVLIWNKVPEYHENILNPEHYTTFTVIKVDGLGKIYACQLLGSRAYFSSVTNNYLTHQYNKPNNFSAFWSKKKLPIGQIFIDDNRNIYYYSAKKKWAKRGLGLITANDGFAADIILKDQYDCDSGIVFNGKKGIKGIPLNPISSKDFNTDSNQFKRKNVLINLGKVPDEIQQEFEVNLTVVNQNRASKSVQLKKDFTYLVNLNIGLYIDSLSDHYQILEYDTLDLRVDYDKAVYKIDKTVLKPVQNILIDPKSTIVDIEIVGYSSIEGSTKLNKELYQKRGQVIQNELSRIGINTHLIMVSSQENFAEFRRDVIETEHAYLSKLTNEELKKKVNDPKLSKALEPILSKHRYSKVRIHFGRKKTIQYKKQKLYEQFNYYVSSGNTSGCRKMQRIEYNLALNGEVNLSDVKAFFIPIEKKYKNILHDRALMIYKLDSTNVNANANLERYLLELKKLDERDTRVNTSIAISNYSGIKSFRKSRKFFKELDNLQSVSPVIKARMKLNLAAKLDLHLYANYGKSAEFRYLFNKVKHYVKIARLNAEETIEIAKYYAFFNENNFAYSITKKKILRTQLISDRLFFIKLIYYSDLSISDDAKLKHLKQIQKVVGYDFCSYFNSPKLNFQLFNFPQVFKFYCEVCN